MTTFVIPEEAKEEIVKRKMAGATWSALSRWVEERWGVAVHRTTLQKWYDREVELLDEEQSEDMEDMEADFTPEAHVKMARKIETYKGESRYWKKVAEAAIKKEAKEDLLIDAIKKFTPSYKEVKKYKHRKPTGKIKGDSVQSMIAPLTDTHIGDNVELEEMMGLNEYNIDIFNKRLYGWANQVITLAELRRNSAEVGELIVPMLGDMISGDIHEELARTNNDHCMGQMIRGANLISQALMFIAPHFDKVRVPCVVGNHGRMTRKPPMKNKYMDWDYMLYQWVSVFCQNQKNIEFHIPKTFMTTINVCNRNILLAHGDFINGGGSGTSINRGVSNMRNVLSFRKGLKEEINNIQDNSLESVPDSYDSALLGHFHRIDEIDIGTGAVHICGCMKGGDEFAMQRVQAINKPRQLVLYYHPKYGEIGKEIIYLNRYDSRKGQFNDILPDVWSKTFS
tara:strand:+ start:375 stop:1733 length:1359 start_codon:yes stop_codon:yes gene_type:complete